jgi:hypothetical protein
VNFRPPEIWLISGPSRSERTALATRVAQTVGRAAHVDGEALWDQLAEGRVTPEADEVESDRQYELAIRNQCLLARSYAEAGFTPVLDFPVLTGHHLEAYQNYLMGARLHFVAIAPPADLAPVGLTVAPDEAGDAILARADEALLRRV